MMMMMIIIIITIINKSILCKYFINWKEQPSCAMGRLPSNGRTVFNQLFSTMSRYAITVTTLCNLLQTSHSRRH